MDQRRNLFTPAQETTNPPPRLITALRSGFDAVANHIGLIVIPLILDLFLWLGPHVSLKTILLPMSQMFASLPGMDAPEMGDLVRHSQELWQTLAEQINLASTLRTYPIGIPSLMAGLFPLDTPFGKAPITEVGSTGLGALLLLVFILTGLVAGSYYFAVVARAVSSKPPEESFKGYAWFAGQAILLSASWLALFLIISLPASMILGIMAMISPAFATLGLMLMGVVLIWILVPLMFSPHGIFMYRQNALYSMLNSVRLVRFILPGTGLFFLTIIILSQGLDLLWQAPPPTSWLTLVALAGHSFVTTSLLAASFVYYHDAMQWVQELVQRSVAARSKLSKI
jgi:hypothetical protein